MPAKSVGYWEDLKEMPEEGPFIVCGGPMGGFARIEHARGPKGIGCPVVPCPELRRWMEENGIPLGRPGAEKLNELYRDGAFVWDGRELKPAKG